MHPLAQKFFNYNSESEKIVSWVRRESVRAASGPLKILDVGCGFGRLLKTLHAAGFDVTGVEVNSGIVSEMRAHGYSVYSPGELDTSGAQFDLLIFSHVIEHFPPAELLVFMDTYLDKLRKGGKVIIATPLMSSAFYNDFDHVRPYPPAAIEAVFGHRNRQVQYHSRHRLKLLDLWFRRGYYRGYFFRSNYIYPSLQTKFLRGIELVTAIIVYLSRGRIGIKNGWVGSFEKI